MNVAYNSHKVMLKCEMCGDKFEHFTNHYKSTAKGKNKKKFCEFCKRKRARGIR